MIAIGSDHAGYALKCEMIKHLEEKGVEFIDCGCNGESVDYPDIAEKTCEKVTSGEADKAYSSAAQAWAFPFLRTR